MSIRDRIRELRRVRAAELQPHPQNWRLHPPRQQAALQAILDDVGYSAALLARELPNGGLELIDGHLRAETTPDELVPVLILDVDADEARRLLAVFDPLGAAAETDRDKLAALLAETRIDSPALRDLVQPQASAAKESAAEPTEMFQLVVDCPDETAQRDLFERLSGEGWHVRALVL